MTTFRISPGPLAAAFDMACARLDRLSFADALWGRRLDVWPGDSATHAKIAHRLGWLGALDFVEPQIPRLQRLGAAVAQDGFTDIVLLGMGGSSLAPEVLRQVLGVADGAPRFRMLDSVDPDAVRAALETAPTSLFVLASKSGSTIEPNVMAAEARRRLEAAGETWGAHVIAITDEGTALHQRAAREAFRDVFVNPADIGGRYSALSFFGLVPAALMGADVPRLVASARAMEAACRATAAAENPGLALGALMAAGALNGRDKLTLRMPARLQAFGLWVEQLVAESTGKQGKGVVPIAGETVEAPLGADRMVVAITLAGDEHGSPGVGAARDAGAPIAELQQREPEGLGAEFLRWEVATAAAGLLLDINPFDEPNVQQAKDATGVLLAHFQREQRLPLPEPHAGLDTLRFTLSGAGEQQLAGAPAPAFLRLVSPGDYVGVLAYLPPDDAAFAGVLDDFRSRVALDLGCATMAGYGPRYLHSTGQLHKGGANNGVFVVITADPDEDLAIPDQPFTFGVLEMAQALGDFQSLDRTGRRALHVHLPRRDVKLLQKAFDALLANR